MCTTWRKAIEFNKLLHGSRDQLLDVGIHRGCEPTLLDLLRFFHPTLERRHPLVTGEIGMPEPDQEHNAQTFAIVDDFVFKAVVEEQALASLPSLPSVCYSDPRTFPWHDESKVAGEPRVGRSAVRCQVSTRAQSRKYNFASSNFSHLDSARQYGLEDGLRVWQKPCNVRVFVPSDKNHKFTPLSTIDD